MSRLVFLTAVIASGCTESTVQFGDPRPPYDPPPADVRLVAAEASVSRLACSAPREERWDRRTSPSFESDPENWLWSGGVIAGDLLSDTLNDLVTPAQPVAQAYKGTPFGTFAEDPCLEPFDLSYGTGGSVADFDGDGLLDVLVTRYNHENRLLHNNGDFTFSDATHFAGVGATGPSLTSTWGDLDHDGDLDLFVGSYADVHTYADREDAHAQRSHLYENLGDGHFADRSELLPERVHEAWVTAASWVDVDRDGWLDLYVVSDLGDFTGNVLVMNEQGTLVADRNRHGLDLIMAGTGLAIADLNDDAIPDFAISETRNLRILLSGVGYWYDAAHELGIALDDARDQHDPWGVDFGDIDNDGDLDLIASLGATHPDDPEVVYRQPDALFIQEEGAFSDVAREWGIADNGAQRGVVLADMNNDGWLDVAKRDLNGPNILYVSACEAEASWIRIQLVDVGPNSYGVGARLTAEAGGREWHRTITSGGRGFGSGGPPEVHLGLGDLTQLDRLTVDWPDGSRSVLEDIPGHAIVRVHRLEP